MTNKEALKRSLKELVEARHNLRNGQKNGVPPEQMAALREKVEYRELVVEALRQMPHGEPLTLEQLRDMDGKPVWCEWLLPEDKAVESGKWFIVVIGDLTGLKILRPLEFGNCFCKEEEYGETWLAYAYPPAHIDREAWEPCECCKPSCKTCANAYAWDTHGKPDVCKKCLCFANFVADDNFCEKCGRPRTEEAWAMLEKRLRG